jgi:hypothetical protein
MEHLGKQVYGEDAKSFWTAAGSEAPRRFPSP